MGYELEFDRMTSTSAPNGEPSKLPRWAQIIAGLLLFPIALLCLAGSVAVVLAPPDKAPRLAMSVGVVLALICLWVLWLAVRLLANRPSHGLLGPYALKAAALLLFALPIGGVFSGYWQERPLIAAVQTLCYLMVVNTLWRLSNRRKHAIQQSIQADAASRPDTQGTRLEGKD